MTPAVEVFLERLLLVAVAAWCAAGVVAPKVLVGAFAFVKRKTRKKQAIATIYHYRCLALKSTYLEGGTLCGFALVVVSAARRQWSFGGGLMWCGDEVLDASSRGVELPHRFRSVYMCRMLVMTSARVWSRGG